MHISYYIRLCESNSVELQINLFYIYICIRRGSMSEFCVRVCATGANVYGKEELRVSRI